MVADVKKYARVDGDRKLSVVPTPSYQDIILERFTAAQTCADKRRALDKQIEALKKEEDKSMTEITRMNKLAYLAGLAKIGEWAEGNAEGPYWYEELISLIRLQTSLYDFRVQIKERTDLKRDRYEVYVRGDKFDLSAAPHEVNGGYRDFNYLSDRYSDATKKFASLGDATDYMFYLAAQITADHTEHIEEELGLLKLMRESGFVYDDKNPLPA